MPTMTIDNGKRIDDLVEIHNLTGPSFFLVSDVHMTRRISLETLRHEFNGDDDTAPDLTNVYYSVQKIKELLSGINENISYINNRITNYDTRYTDYYNQIMAEIASIWNDIEDRYQFLFKWLDTLDAREARHYENLCEWMYRLRNDLRERLRDLDYREQNHWVDHENRVFSLEYRMYQAEARLDDAAARIDDIEVWKWIYSNPFTHILVEIDKDNIRSINDEDDFDTILRAIDRKLKDLHDRVTAIEEWKKITSTFTYITVGEGSSKRSIRQGDSLDVILQAIDKRFEDHETRITDLENKLPYAIRAGTALPSNLEAKTIYLQYFD